MDAINYIGVKKGIVKRFSGTKGKIVFCSSEEEECSGELFCYKIDVVFKMKYVVFPARLAPKIHKQYW
jgi:hypothetical protein